MVPVENTGISGGEQSGCMSGRLFIVFLRQPGKNDGRDDPFWEFGSFGCTGCHRGNLLHPMHCQVKNGDMLAFVQGGPKGCRLLLITPPVKRVNHLGPNRPLLVELRWEKTARPFRYSDRAPLLAGSEQDVPASLTKLGMAVNQTERSTAAAKLASRFRARCRPVEPLLAGEIMQLFHGSKTTATEEDFINNYEDALPWINPYAIAQDRRKNYRNLLARITIAGGRGTSSCHPSSGYGK